MNKQTVLSVTVMFISLPVLVSLATAQDVRKKGETVPEITVTGIVITSDEDALGNISAVSIEVQNRDSYEYYYIVMDDKGKQLLDQVNNIVKITGRVQGGKFGRQELIITRWELLSRMFEDPMGSQDQDEGDLENDEQETIDL